MNTKLLLCVALASLVAGCGDQQPPATSTPEVLRIATEGAYAPFNYTNNDGSLAGFDVDIAHALCDQMTVRCEIAAQDWDGIIPALKTGKFDAIISSMSVTPERSEQVDFSEPYFANTLVFLAKKDSSFDPANTSDIRSAKIAAQGSTISAQWLEKTHPNATLQLHATLDNAFLDLGNDRSSVMIADKLPALTWLKSDLGKNFAIKGQEIDINDHFAVAINKDQLELLAKFNQAILDIKADGTYDALIVKHFGTEFLAKPDTDNQTITDNLPSDKK